MSMIKPPDPLSLAATIEAALAVPLNTPALRKLRRQYSKQIAAAPGTDVLRLALQLLKNPTSSHRFIAYELILHHPEASSRIGEKELKKLGVGLDSWAAVDMFACYLAGQAWREERIVDAVVHRWAAESDRWWRRAALVSTVPLNSKAQGGSSNASRTLVVCRLLLDDRDDMVVKAMSWALRELSKRDPNAVTEFIEKHRSRFAARVLREVGNKLRTGKKNPRARKQAP